MVIGLDTDHGVYSPDSTLSADATWHDIGVSLGHAKHGVAENAVTIAAPNIARFCRIRRHRVTLKVAFFELRSLLPRLSFLFCSLPLSPSLSRTFSLSLSRALILVSIGAYHKTTTKTTGYQ